MADRQTDRRTHGDFKIVDWKSRKVVGFSKSVGSRNLSSEHWAQSKVTYFYSLWFIVRKFKENFLDKIFMFIPHKNTSCFIILILNFSLKCTCLFDHLNFTFSQIFSHFVLEKKCKSLLKRHVSNCHFHLRHPLLRRRTDLSEAASSTIRHRWHFDWGSRASHSSFGFIRHFAAR
jgi:hypothetical protein